MGEINITPTPLDNNNSKVSQIGHFASLTAGAGNTRFKVGPKSVSVGNVESGSNYILWDGTTLAINASINTNNVKTVFPQFIQGTNERVTMDLISNTTARIGMVSISNGITVNRITVRSGAAVLAAGTADIAIYSEDGQTKFIDVETPSISATYSYYTATVSPAVNLPVGNYYIAIVPNGSTSATYIGWVSALDDDTYALAGGKVVVGTMTVTAGTLPASFNPVSDITFAQHNTPAVRLDNV